MVEEMLVWLMVELMVGELGEGIIAGSPIGFSESSRKTSHIVSHSQRYPCLISAISLCRLAGIKEVV